MAEFVEVMRLDARMRSEEECMDFLHKMDDLLSFDPARFEKAVMRWAKLHPEKTLKDVFFEKFPNADKRSNGMPVICLTGLGFAKREGIGECSFPFDCEHCWNQPAPEE